MRNSFIDLLTESAIKDPRILLITADLGFGVVERFRERVPNQFYNLGITEQSAVSISCGLAATGFRPFLYSIANFPTFRAMEQIRNDMNYMNLPVTVVALGEGFSYGSAGYSHHLVEDIGSLRSFGALSIFSPTQSREIAQSLEKILDLPSPAVIRLGKKPSIEPPQTDIGVNFIGFTRQLNGDQNLLVFHGGCLDDVHKARNILAGQGINPTIYSCFNFNRELIDVFLRSHPESSILIVEEHVLAGGLGTIFLESANELGWRGKIRRLGISKIDVYAVGSQEYLRKLYGLDPQGIADSFIKMLENNV
jgi:transketolase